jgi:GTP-binding protein
MDEDNRIVLADLTRPAQRLVFLKGGDGGFGNAHYKSSTNRAPRRADPGWPGREAWVWLRLKLIADAGLVGLPNAGKSTFLAAVTHARPKIADYAFTTLKPQLGVVRQHDEEFVLADLPGLIEGASDGAGIGTRFLGHVERCAVVLHLVDGTLDDVAGAYRTIRQELAGYGHGLAEKTEIVGLNKIDALDPETVAAKCRELQAAVRPGTRVIPLSGATGAGATDVIEAVLAAVSEARADEKDGAKEEARSFAHPA